MHFSTTQNASQIFRKRCRTSREFLDEYDDVKVEAVDFATLDTPAKWNSVCREVIWHNYDLMRPHTQLLFHDYFTERYGEKISKQIADCQKLSKTWGYFVAK
jgi:hypothetical protein